MVNTLNHQDKIFIAGHRGLLGSAIVRRLTKDGYVNILTATRDKVDLTDSFQVYNFFEKNRPEYVFLAAAKVGGLFYNKNFPADFLRENILIQTNVIDAAYRFGCKKLLFVGSACVYPKNASSPIGESSFMAGDLDPTNISYAMSKIIGHIMCKKYYEQYGFNCISIMPNNIYGINDSLGEVIEKLTILHIRTWMLEDAIQAASTDEEIATLKRKIDICFKVKRPKYVEAINLNYVKIVRNICLI